MPETTLIPFEVTIIGREREKYFCFAQSWFDALKSAAINDVSAFVMIRSMSER